MKKKREMGVKEIEAQFEKQSIVADVDGSRPIKFHPGHSCGRCFGFGVYVGQQFTGEPGGYTFEAGGVMDYTDIIRLYDAIPENDREEARVALSEGKKLGRPSWYRE
jgi:hypothetical protein